MRCPKCGYTSFDNQDRCKKCKKRLSASAATLGMVVSAVPPSFLFVAEPEQEVDDFAEAEDVVVDLSGDDDTVLDLSAPDEQSFPAAHRRQETSAYPSLLADEEGVDLQLADDFEAESPAKEGGFDSPAALADEEGIDFELADDFEAESPAKEGGFDFPAALAEEEGIDFELADDFEAESPAKEGGFDFPAALADEDDIDPRLSRGIAEKGSGQELDLDFELDLPLDDDAAADTAAAPRIGIDLAKLDISDLQAPQAAEIEMPEDGKTVADTAAESEEEPAPSVLAAFTEELGDFEEETTAPAQEEFSLEDLQVDGLDVGKTALPDPGPGYHPAMKTGTALDSFHFELQELLAVDENEKA